MSEQNTTSGRGRRQVKVGTVVSSKMDKTVVVTVTNTFMHRLYHRYMKRTSKFYADDPQNECGIGDTVSIAECRPMSKTKSWSLVEVINKAG